MENNTIAAFHIRSNKDGILELYTGKKYHWHIPKTLRENPIQKGDVVLVRTTRGVARVLVMEVFREEYEETKKEYQRVVKVIERASKKEPVS
ncbi:DUF5839 family protein [Actinomadura geliboluensis]|uniref:DUF5839 family protein n=1 Tax=Actinomadura geliboluensis TaxID=882440 RepID=UPI00030051DD|nr:DUF5839 family protein [Actinomadura geliboluensis]